MDKYKKYLPSPLFTFSVMLIIVIIGVFFFGKSVFVFIKNKIKEKSGPTKVTVVEVLEKDSNGNGFPDWEERLWGLNPNKNSEENAQFIMSKKKDIALTNGNTGIQKENTTSFASKEILATILSLQQSGGLNEQNMGTLTSSITSGVETKNIPDIYTKENMKIVPDTQANKDAYYKKFESSYKKYEAKDIGKELVIISQGIANNDVNALYASRSIGEAYQEFGKELFEVNVPVSLYSYHLDICNNLHKTGQAVLNMSYSLADPLNAMNDLLTYKKYSDNLVSSVENLTNNIVE